MFGVWLVIGCVVACFGRWLLLVRFCCRFVAVFIACVMLLLWLLFNSVGLCYVFDVACFLGFVVLDISVLF